MLSLLEHGDQWERLHVDPRLITPAVEKLLRYQSPNQLGNRRTVTAVKVGDVELPEGALITLGMWLARMEGRVALGRLVQRFPDLRPAGMTVRGRRARFRTLVSLPVAV